MKTRKAFSYSKYNSWSDGVQIQRSVVANADKFLSEMMPSILGREIWRVNNDGIMRTMKVSDALMHVFTEEVHHRGEIIAILWQTDIQPPDIGWFSTLNRTNPKWHMK